MLTDLPAARPPEFGEHDNAISPAAPPEDGGARSSMVWLKQGDLRRHLAGRVKL